MRKAASVRNYFCGNAAKILEFYWCVTRENYFKGFKKKVKLILTNIGLKLLVKTAHEHYLRILMQKS